MWDSSSTGTVPKAAFYSNTSPCWINGEVVPAADQDFPKISGAQCGYWTNNGLGTISLSAVSEARRVEHVPE
jgi:hypothetical protein